MGLKFSLLTLISSSPVRLRLTENSCAVASGIDRTRPREHQFNYATNEKLSKPFLLFSTSRHLGRDPSCREKLRISLSSSSTSFSVETTKPKVVVGGSWCHSSLWLDSCADCLPY